MLFYAFIWTVWSFIILKVRYHDTENIRKFNLNVLCVKLIVDVWSFYKELGNKEHEICEASFMV